MSITWYAPGELAILAIGVGKEMRRSWQGPLRSGTGSECHVVVDKRVERAQGEIYQKEGLGDPTEGKIVVNGDCSVALFESRKRMSLPSPGSLLLQH